VIRIAWYATIVLVTLTALVLLWQFSVAIVLFLLSLAVAAAFRPMIEELGQRGLRREFSLAISFGLVFAVLAALFLIASGPLVADIQQGTDDLLKNYERVKNDWLQGQDPLLSNLSDQLPATQDLYDSLTGDGSSLAIQAIFGAAEGTFAFLARLAIVLVLSLYWSADQVRFERLWLSLLPVEGRARARAIWHDIESGVGASLRREVTLSVLAGVSLWLGYLALGIKYATLLALIGGLARMIPWLGSVLVVVFPLMVGSNLGWGASLAAAIYTLLALTLLETTLGSKIFPRQRTSSLLLVIVLIVLADSYGLLGAILAPILTVAIQSLVYHFLPRYAAATNGAQLSVAAPANSYDQLKTKMEAINQMAENLDGPHASESANLAARLEQLLEKSLPP
jgi:putative permease